MKPAPENFDDVVIADFEPSTEPVKAPSYCSNTTGQTYTPPKWEPVRADPSRQITSRGVSC